MFRIDIAKQVSAGISPLTIIADIISWAIRGKFGSTRTRRQGLRFSKPRRKIGLCWSSHSLSRIRISTRRARLVILMKILSTSGVIKGREMFTIRVNKETTLKRIRTKLMVVTTILYVWSVEISIWEYVRWGQIPSIFVARKATIRQNYVCENTMQVHVIEQVIQ